MIVVMISVGIACMHGNLYHAKTLTHICPHFFFLVLFPAEDDDLDAILQSLNGADAPAVRRLTTPTPTPTTTTTTKHTDGQFSNFC
mgnify:CR=1 FL=1